MFPHSYCCTTLYYRNDRKQAKERRRRVAPTAALTGASELPRADESCLFPVPAVRVCILFMVDLVSVNVEDNGIPFWLGNGIQTMRNEVLVTDNRLG